MHTYTLLLCLENAIHKENWNFLFFFFLSVKSPWTDNVFSSRNAIFEIFYIGIYLFLHAVMLFIF